MGGWLIDDGEIVASREPKLPDFPFKLDANGRAISPHFPMLDRVEFATFEQKCIALAWSQQWQQIRGLIDFQQAAVDLDKFLLGTLRRRDTSVHERELLGGASRVLYGSCHRNAARRTARAFPWLELTVIDAHLPCQKAISLAGRLFPEAQHPQLPLPDCDSARCSCFILQRTEGERVRRGYVDKDGDGWRIPPSDETTPP